MTEIAKKRGIKGFEASVLVGNHGMLSVFHNSGFNVVTKKEDDTYYISYDFQK